jgi:hypothetical protein
MDENNQNLGPGTTKTAQPVEKPSTDLLQFQLTQKLRSISGWFTIIGVLSVVDAVIFLGGGKSHFLVGLILPLLFSSLYQDAGVSWALQAGLVVTILAAGFFVGLAILTRKKHLWALILGIVLYGLDTLLYIALLQDWFSIALHGLALFQLFLHCHVIG